VPLAFENGRLLTLQDCMPPIIATTSGTRQNAHSLPRWPHCAANTPKLISASSASVVRVKGDTAEADARGSATGTRPGALRERIEDGEFRFRFPEAGQEPGSSTALPKKEKRQ